MNERDENLYLQALKIREDGEPGLWLPKIQALAIRGHADAMVDLADWLSGDSHRLGHVACPYTAATLYRRAYRVGNARAAHNLAMTYFNRNDLGGYRHWIRKAGNAGDGAARLEAACFETRQPHANARRIGRLRPEQKRDEFA